MKAIATGSARGLIQLAVGRGRAFFFLLELIVLCKIRRENFERIRLREDPPRFPRPWRADERGHVHF